MNITQIDVLDKSQWGPSVRYVYTNVVPGLDINAPRTIKVGLKHSGNVVLAVKFSNQGTNSKMFVGNSKNNSWEEIPVRGGAEISFGTGFPNHIETEFDIRFENIAVGDATHYGLVIEAVVNCK